MYGILSPTNCFIYFPLPLAILRQIAQALTFFMFNGSFCTVGLGCSLSFGSYYSMGAWGSYFVASVILCFSPKPDPICCKKEDNDGEMQEEYPVIEPDEDGYHKAVVE